MIVAIDPGTEQSAYIAWHGGRFGVPPYVDRLGIVPNAQLVKILRAWYDPSGAPMLIIEKVESFGMAVGWETFETVFWSGRFAQAWGAPFDRIGRREIKLHLCGSARAKDANIRQALIDRFGPPGTKKKPGTLYGVKTHLWAALAVAVTAWDWMHPEQQGDQS